MFIPPLERDASIANRAIMDIFHCACEGGIRYSSKTQTIILVNNTLKNNGENIWKNGVFYFTGQGRKEEQTMTGANKRLAEFLKEGKDVFLFEVKIQGEYIYRGPVQTAGAPFMRQRGTGPNGSQKVWIFPLKLK